jgi:voltage-gated potassium channel
MDTPVNPWRQVRVGVGALLGVLIAGTVAYSLLGLSPFDAFYQTLITISTVGYTEIGDSIGPGYRVVSAVLILVGVGVALYTIGAAFEAIMEGRLREHMGRARMRHTVDQMKDHVIVCGWGRVGQAISRELRAKGEDVVIVDQREDLYDEVDVLAVQGDATVDAVLLEAGIERARGLIIALDSAADCMYVTLTSRTLNPDLLIVARAHSAEAAPKLRQAGADRVVSPHEIGGSRMASFISQPSVADFLNDAMRNEQLAVELQEFEVGADSPIADRTLRDSKIGEKAGVTVVAVRRADGNFTQSPNADTKVYPGDVAIVLGTARQLEAFRAWLDGS